MYQKDINLTLIQHSIQQQIQLFCIMILQSRFDII